jgi:hypothetical protein
MREIINAYRILVGNPEGKVELERLAIGEGLVLELILNRI